MDQLTANPAFKDNFKFIESFSDLFTHYTRLKLTNECMEEEMERLQDENEQYDGECSQLNQALHEYRENAQGELELQGNEYQKEITELKEQHKTTISDLQKALHDARMEILKLRADLNIAQLPLPVAEIPLPTNRVICECGMNLARSSMPKHKESATHMVRMGPHV